MSTTRFAKPESFTAPKGYCRYCKKKIENPRRRSFCSEECVREFDIRTSASSVLYWIFKRDNGICRKCGRNAEEAKSRHEKLESGMKNKYWENLWEWDLEIQARFVMYREIEMRRLRNDFQIISPERSWWEADHVIPVSKGGGECGLENYQTLCVRCHKEETAVLKADLAIDKRTDKLIQGEHLEMFGPVDLGIFVMGERA